RMCAEHRRQACLYLASARTGLAGTGVDLAGRDLLGEQELAGTVGLVLVEVQADGCARLVDASVLVQCWWEIWSHQPRLAELTHRAVLREPDDHPVLVRIPVDAQRANRQRFDASGVPSGRGYFPRTERRSARWRARSACRSSG